MSQSFPCTGDIILIDFNPQSGIEIMKRRPALVVSNNAFNKLTGLALVCPITSTQRDYPLHVILDERTNTHGDIVCEQVKSLDYKVRNWHYLESVPDYILDKVLFNLNAIIGK